MLAGYETAILPPSENRCMSVRFKSSALVTAPAAEPVSLTEAKAHCRIDGTADDALLTALIKAAREHVEIITGSALVTQTLDIKYDSFGPQIDLPHPPLQSVTSIKYLDDSGVEQTLASSVYRVNADRYPASITLDYNQAWPNLYPVSSPVTVRLVAGYGAASAVPQPIKQALLLLVGHWYENREESIAAVSLQPIPTGVAALLAGYRVSHF